MRHQGHPVIVTAMGPAETPDTGNQPSGVSSAFFVLNSQVSWWMSELCLWNTTLGVAYSQNSHLEAVSEVTPSPSQTSLGCPWQVVPTPVVLGHVWSLGATS